MNPGKLVPPLRSEAARSRHRGVAPEIPRRAGAAPDTYGDSTMATQPPPNLPLFYKDLQPLAASMHGKLKARSADSAPVSRQRPRDSADDRRVRARAAPLPDRLLGRREPGAAGADGPQRGRQRLRRRRGQAARPVLRAGLCPPLSLHARPARPGDARSCRSASIPTSDLIGEFEDGEPLFDDDKPSETLNAHPQILRGVRDRRPAHPGLRQGAARRWTC